MENNQTVSPTKKVKRFGCLQVAALMMATALVTAVAAFVLVKYYLFPSEFTPVTLSNSEEKALASKLDRIDAIKKVKGPYSTGGNGKISHHERPGNTAIEPEPYSEEGAKREIAFTERELNSLVAKNTDLATKFAIDLSDDLVSAKLLLPVDEDFPILGGKILRLKSGMVFSYTQGKPVVILKGVSIMGVPVPNAWLGDIKNVDLIETYGKDEGFWKSFSDGIEEIKVQEGLLKIRFKE